MKIEDAIKKVREGKKRNFVQTFDLIINLKNIDLKKPENNFTKDIQLPHGIGKDIKIGIISDSNKYENTITKKDIEALAKNKKDAKKFIKEYQFFLCEAPLMVFVGKALGKYLGPSGKMPKPFPPGADINPLLEAMKKSVKISVRGSPVIHVPVGKEDMSDKEIKENVERVIEETIKSLPKGRNQIKNILLKLTMGKPVEIDF